MTDFTNQFLGVIKIDKGARNDVWGLDETTGFLTERKNNHKDTFTRDVNTILDDSFMYWLIGIVIELIANMDATIFANSLVW